MAYVVCDCIVCSVALNKKEVREKRKLPKPILELIQKLDLEPNARKRVKIMAAYLRSKK